MDAIFSVVHSLQPQRGLQFARNRHKRLSRISNCDVNTAYRRPSFNDRYCTIVKLLCDVAE